MAENRRPSRPKTSGPRATGKPAPRNSGKPTGKATGKPTGKPTGKSTGQPTGKRGPGSDDRRSERPERRTDQRGTRAGAGRPARSGDWKRPTDKQVDRTKAQQEYDGPDLPEDITGAELDRSVSAQLKGLPEKLASRVARHLAAAGLFIDEDPELAYRHTLAARARAQRLAVVREAVGEAAYAAGHYAEALAELRAAKRMNGATDYLPIMADCHRALGQFEQAVRLAKSPSVAGFAPAAKAEMTIVEAGARRDMGQLDAALRTLELAPLTSKSREAWVVRLRYAYADTLEAAGRESDALAWFHRTTAIDGDEITDATTRAELLEKRIGD